MSLAGKSGKRDQAPGLAAGPKVLKPQKPWGSNQPQRLPFGEGPRKIFPVVMNSFKTNKFFSLKKKKIDFF